MQLLLIPFDLTDFRKAVGTVVLHPGSSTTDAPVQFTSYTMAAPDSATAHDDEVFPYAVENPSAHISNWSFGLVSTVSDTFGEFTTTGRTYPDGPINFYFAEDAIIYGSPRAKFIAWENILNNPNVTTLGIMLRHTWDTLGTEVTRDYRCYPSTEHASAPEPPVLTIRTTHHGMDMGTLF